MKNQHKKLWTFLFVILNIAIVAYIAFSEFYGKRDADVTPEFSRHWLFYLICAIGCLAVMFLAETVKYAYMMKILGEKVSWRAAFETAALGKYYDSLTPSGAGGQPFQIYWLHKKGYSDGSSSAMPIIGFLTMQTGFIILAFVCFTTWRSVDVETIRYTAYFGLVAYSVVPALILAFSFKPQGVEKFISSVIHFGARLHIVKNADESVGKAVEQLNDFHNSFRLVSYRKGVAVKLMILSTIYQIALCSIAFFVLKMLGGQSSYLHVLATMAYIYATVTIIVTPGNSGAAEGVFYIVFSAIGSEGVFWAMIIWRLLTYYSFIGMGGLVYGFHALSSRRKAGKEAGS